VGGLLQKFSEPAELALWAKTGIAELTNSLTEDVSKKKAFTYLTRLRQVEELYHRTLYMLLIAERTEMPHILSGEQPNTFATMWREVNRVVLEGRGTLETSQVGLNGEEFTGMSILHNSAHASLSTMATSVGIVRNPGDLAEIAKKHLPHRKRFWAYLNYMEGMFRDGKAKTSVLSGVKKIHKPASAWQSETPTK
jgi:hypothetical protein